MQDEKDKIKDLAASGLAQFEAKPPGDMWERIDQQVRRRKRIVLFRVVAMAASVLILLGIGISLLLPGSEKDVIRNHMATKDGKNAAQEFVPEQEPSTTAYPGRAGRSETGAAMVLPDPAEPGPETLRKSPAARAVMPVFEKEEMELVPEAIAFVSGELVADQNQVTDTLDAIKQIAEAVPSVSEGSPILVQPKDSGKTGQPPAGNHKKGSNWELAVGYGTTPAIELSQKEYALNSRESNFSYDKLSADVANETSYFEEVEKTTHNAPVTFGVLISKRLGKRWNIESGLVYTKLGYLIRTDEMNKSYREYRNELFYLGIPMGVRFNILERRRFGMYATQSLILEKGITGRGYTDSYSQGILKGSESSKISIRGIQLSSLTGIGGEVKIAGKFSVYGQTGVQLFYLNGSQPYNIRSARMVWPSFQAGLRIQLD